MPTVQIFPEISITELAQRVNYISFIFTLAQITYTE